MSSVRQSALPSCRVDSGVAKLSGEFPLHFGDTLSEVKVAWRIAGAANAPIVAVLGGISAGQIVFGSSPSEQGWWKEIAGPGRALDANAFRILGFDFLGGSGATTGPKAGQRDFPSISAFDQAALLARLLPEIGVEKLHA